MARTLRELQKQTPFEKCFDDVEGDSVEDSRAVYQETLQVLIDLGTAPARERCLEILGAYIEAFNALDAKYGQFIETTGREAICETVVDMAHACGIDDIDCDDVPGAGRDW